ncbi:hypothetical protein HUJ05_001376 [Dendroctonus ponderosae]|nr:hypothetical protein HUJ05_001376 [Dendroctonus ponderosae]
MMPSRKRMMLFMSPFFAIFMYFLLISAYIYSLDLSGQELPSTVGHIDFRSGINRPNDLKWIELLAKSMIGVLIFTTMRRLLQEKALANQQAVENVAGSSSLTPEANDANLLSFAEPLKSSILRFFATWWIWIVVLTMLWMEFWNKSSLFRITFVVLVMIFLITFQISLITASLAMAMRMDAMAILLGLWLLIMFTLSRKWML